MRIVPVATGLGSTGLQSWHDIEITGRSCLRTLQASRVVGSLTVGSTPLWMPFAVAGIGLFGIIVRTISGVLVTQRRFDGREERTWERARSQERELRARGDVPRNFETRRDAYTSFYEALREMARTAYDHGMGLSEVPAEDDEQELPLKWNESAFPQTRTLP